MDSRTPSLGDGGLVHFSGPRLIRYDQLPLSPMVVTPTKVFLRNSILSLVRPHIVIQNKTPIRRSILQVTPDQCQTRIGIGALHMVHSYKSDSRVQGDCDHRPVPVCED